MKGACIKRIDQFIVDRLIQMGYKRVKQDIYFHGLFVEGGNIWQTDMPFKPWNPDGEIWKDCKSMAHALVEKYKKGVKEMNGYTILAIVFAILLIVIIIIKEVHNKEVPVACTIICATLYGAFVAIGCYEREPTALDVYRGKTTLEITYRDSVAIDPTVVYKVR